MPYRYAIEHGVLSIYSLFLKMIWKQNNLSRNIYLVENAH